ncbi:hypothetical protein DOTSEDRAFT_45238 [Dothistroma septosporum NZE10]|uniref:Uncharacterized protein n=1 Tax=Dothistroma septosporum (strain NZE10 / CBS 128990) TaxID=675120 RepID=M2XLD0_DOTSN|nr:hypothetical protein DOTSEDRAFT_45238 [Dothistroma septosporum NZE10]
MQAQAAERSAIIKDARASEFREQRKVKGKDMSKKSPAAASPYAAAARVHTNPRPQDQSAPL